MDGMLLRRFYMRALVYLLLHEIRYVNSCRDVLFFFFFLACVSTRFHVQNQLMDIGELLYCLRVCSESSRLKLIMNISVCEAEIELYIIYKALFYST